MYVPCLQILMLGVHKICFAVNYIVGHFSLFFFIWSDSSTTVVDLSTLPAHPQSFGSDPLQCMGMSLIFGKINMKFYARKNLSISYAKFLMS